MCYSAQIQAEYNKYCRAFGADISLAEYYELFFRRAREASNIKLPKALEAWFATPANADEAAIKALIDEFNLAEAGRLEQLLFVQRKRLADAQRQLRSKTTKAATESQRIASRKVEWALEKRADLRRSVLEDRDARMFPGWYVPVLVVEGGRRRWVPMRYQCRPSGKPASFDDQYPGTYNARRDSLGGFWKQQFGATHGVLLVDRFYENVSRVGPDGQPVNVVLEFRPALPGPMLVACLWSRWSGAGQADLLSFAAITDEPPTEVAAAGHDRCIIPIKPEHLDAWLSPDPANLQAQQAILDDRERPYYEHRLAA